ncbi:MAG: hypothetical protein K6E75_04635 [Lachnospiraceae bacterium]|nr:hypothetical protein [Lachnospiraceae bacterium]
MGRNMQYRAMRPDGECDMCTCRGTVLKTEDGMPEFLVGAIRNHSQKSHIDTLTGLRNQYGFSSVGLVKNMPFDTIKIDRSFVRQIEEDEVEKKLLE